MYVAFGVEASGLNVPVPPLHVPLEAPPPIAPASCTCGLLEHTVWGSPALAVAARLMVMRIVSLTTPHGPLGSFVVSASDTPPAAISAAFGVYVALSPDALGLNVPAPPLHVPLEAPPPTAPASCTCGLLAHTAWSAPASAV